MGRRIALKRVVFPLTALILGAFVALVVFEIALRAAGFHYMTLSFEPAGEKWQTYTRVFTLKEIAFDPALFWKAKPNQGVINQEGFRGPLISDLEEGTNLVIAIGDSNTMGWLNPPGHNWPSFLHEMLKDRGTSVVNAGVHGYTSHQAAILIERISKHAPDIVLVAVGANDGHHKRFSDVEFERRARLHAMVGDIRVGQLALKALDTFFPLGTGNRVPRVSVEQFEKNLLNIRATCQRQQIQCVLLTRPFRPIPNDDEARFWKFTPAYNEIIRAVGNHPGTTTVDLARAFDSRPYFMADESHFTVAGQLYAASLLAHALEPLVGPPPGREQLQVMRHLFHVEGFVPHPNNVQWLEPHAIWSDIPLRADASHRFLVLERHGYGNIAEGAVQVALNGVPMRYAHSSGPDIFFHLDDRELFRGELRIRSPQTSRAHEIERITYHLGLDLRSIRLH